MSLEFRKLETKYADLHERHTRTVHDKKLIEQEKEIVLEELFEQVEEIEKLKPFWQFFAYLRLVAKLAFEIKQWRNRNNESVVKIPDGSVHPVKKSL